MRTKPHSHISITFYSCTQCSTCVRTISAQDIFFFSFLFCASKIIFSSPISFFSKTPLLMIFSETPFPTIHSMQKQDTKPDHAAPYATSSQSQTKVFTISAWQIPLHQHIYAVAENANCVKAFSAILWLNYNQVGKPGLNKITKLKFLENRKIYTAMEPQHPVNRHPWTLTNLQFLATIPLLTLSTKPSLKKYPNFKDN